MRLLVTIDHQTLAADSSKWNIHEQSELIIALLCQAEADAIANALKWIGENGCGYGVCVPVPAKDREAAAISAFLAACYQRHDKGTKDGDAIRGSIRAEIAVQEGRDLP